MRRLLVVVLVAALAWGGYWFVGARAVESGLTAWIDQRRAEGWAADYATLNTRGFPNRFDTTITDLQLADPHTGVAWTAPFFQILALSYRPNHVIAVWPDSRRSNAAAKHLADQRHDARLCRTAPGPSLELDRSTFELVNVKLDIPRGLVGKRRNRAALAHVRPLARLTPMISGLTPRACAPHAIC